MDSLGAMLKRPRLVHLGFCAATLVLLTTACGGGGADESTPEAAVEAAVEVTAAPAPATDAQTSQGNAGSQSAPGVAGADCGIAGFSSAALARINQIRAAGASCGARGPFAAAGAVRWNDALAEAAAGHSLDMAAQNYFSHTSADGRTMSARVNATGFAWSTLGENIAAGQVGIDAVLDGWMHSDGHCANLMNPAFDAIGLACAPGLQGSRYRTYWTLNLARAR